MKFLQQAVDALQAFEVSYAILGHGALPLEHPREEGLGAQADDLVQLIAHDAQDVLIGERKDLFIACPAKEAPEKSAIVGSAMGELIMDEGCRKHALAFGAR